MPIYATREQTMQAIRDLTDDEMTMLARGASKRLRGTDFSEPSDLISEAIARLMRPGHGAGRPLDPGAAEPDVASEDDGWEGLPRRWPLHMNFGRCLQLIIRSIANGSRLRIRNKPGSHADIDPEVGGGAVPDDARAFAPRHERLRAPSAEDDALHIERGRLALRAAELARDSLKGDVDAQRVIDGMVAGLTRAEACDELGILPELYEPARKRAIRILRRRAGPLFGLTWKGLFDDSSPEGHPHG